MTKKSTYTDKDIKTLSEIEHVQHSVGMYIGQTSNPVHLIEEALDNAIDEAIAGHANIIAITLDTKTNIYSVLDNGRGVPLENDTPILISTKLFTGGKFESAKTAYKISCLRGNTKIFLLNGKTITIKEMSDDPNNEYWGLSSTTDGKWKANKLLSPRVTGRTKKFVRVYIDNGEFVDCTEDHLFLMRDGSYKMAMNLEINDSLMPLYKKIDSNEYINIRPNNTYDYIRNITFENRSFIPLHKIVYSSINDEPPKFSNIHHSDLNKQNNYPDNLLLIKSPGEHITLHSKIRSENNEIPYPTHLVEYSKSEKGRNKSREIGIKYIKALNEYVKTEKHRKSHSVLLTNYNNKENEEFNHRQKYLKYCKSLLKNNLDINIDNWEKYRPYGLGKFEKIFKRFNNIEELISESSNYKYDLYDLIETNGKISMIKRMVSILKRADINTLPLTEDSFNITRKKLDPTLKAINNYFGNFSNFVEYYKTNNHKVERIEIIDLEEEEEVYDLTSPIYENFALDCGIVVHNSGTNGIGLITLLALSDFYIIEIYKDNKHAKYIFEDAKLKQKIIEDYNETPPFSTKIQFKPSKKFFESLIPDIDRIRKRLIVASVEIPDVTLVLNIDKKKEVIKLTKDEFFKKHCLNGDTLSSKSIEINSKDGIEKFDVKFCYSYEGAIAPRIISSINLLPVDDGGTHVNSFYDLLKEFFIFKTKKTDFKFLPNDCLSGLRVYFSLELEKADYSSQSKDKLITRKDHFVKFINKIKLELEKYFIKNPQELTEILTFFDEYRKKIDSKKIKTGPVNGKRASTKFTKLRDCTGTNGELYVVEGDSAGGGFIECRTTKIHAVLPLRGKVPSIINNKNDILKNREIGELIGSLGTGIGPNFDITKLKYDKIICTTDPDPDGGHIFCLMAIALAVLVPEVIKQGHFYLSKVPLYAEIGKGKTFNPIWTNDELIKVKAENKETILIKGLGQLSPWQLKICCLDENTRKLERVEFTEDMEKIVQLFSDVNCKRELLKMV